jgi:hypothetical protein
LWFSNRILLEIRIFSLLSLCHHSSFTPSCNYTRTAGSHFALLATGPMPMWSKYLSQMRAAAVCIKPQDPLRFASASVAPSQEGMPARGNGSPHARGPARRGRGSANRPGRGRQVVLVEVAGAAARGPTPAPAVAVDAAPALRPRGRRCARPTARPPRLPTPLTGASARGRLL